jgi:hypothetical protein
MSSHLTSYLRDLKIETILSYLQLLERRVTSLEQELDHLRRRGNAANPDL